LKAPELPAAALQRALDPDVLPRSRTRCGGGHSMVVATCAPSGLFAHSSPPSPAHRWLAPAQPHRPAAHHNPVRRIGTVGAGRYVEWRAAPDSAGTACEGQTSPSRSARTAWKRDGAPTLGRADTWGTIAQLGRMAASLAMHARSSCVATSGTVPDSTLARPATSAALNSAFHRRTPVVCRAHRAAAISRRAAPAELLSILRTGAKTALVFFMPRPATRTRAPRAAPSFWRLWTSLSATAM